MLRILTIESSKYRARDVRATRGKCPFGDRWALVEMKVSRKREKRIIAPKLTCSFRVFRLFMGN